MASSSSGAGRPNILLILTDQQRFDTIQALGSRFAAKTPAMDSLARDGVSFDQAYCTAPVCSPSRATLVTGLYPSQVGMPALVNDPCPPLATAIPTVGRLLRSGGYETAYHGKWHLGGKPSDHGFEVSLECSLDEATRLAATRFWKDRDWLENERPFFHVVSFLNPHDLYFYDPEREVAGFERPWARGEGKLPSFPAGRQVDWKEERWGAYFRFYEQMIERVDADIGETLHQLRCSGFFRNTWIIFTTDHGDMAGEHNLPFKGPFMYEGVVRVPLIIVPPRARFGGPPHSQVDATPIAAGRRGAICSLLDIVPTVLDLASVPAPERLPGRSLVPLVRDAAAPSPHEYVFAEYHHPPIRMARSAGWKYVLYRNGEEELYDMKGDGGELRNLAASEEHAAMKARHRAALEDHLRATGDPFHRLELAESAFQTGRGRGRGR